MVGGTAYSKYTIASLGQTAPGGGASDNWRLRFRAIVGGAENANATLSIVMGDVNNDYVPQDYSVVLDNSAASIFANLRTENAYITGLDIGSKYATLYVDNAVNITSVTGTANGTAGDPLNLTVTVKNTGRYTDTYGISAGGSMDPPIGPLAPGASGSTVVTTVYPAGSQAIVVTAAGAYATDKDNSFVAIGVQPIVFRAYDTGYASDTALGIAPWKLYGLSDNAPIMVAKKIGAGAVAAYSLDGGASYYGSASYPSAINMDILLDITFQWMVPGATKILWYEGDNVYSGYKNTDADVKKLLDNLRAGAVPSGNSYTIDNGNMLRLDNLGLYTTYDILVINQEQNGTPSQGGNPSSLWDNELDNIRNWVAAGKGVIVQEVSDYSNYCYNRVSNRILDNLGFGWWFQHDTINDATRNDLAASYKPLVVRVVGNEIGDNYAAQTGIENILAYKCPTLVPRPTIAATVVVPSSGVTEGTLGVIVPVTITNTSTVWDNFSISVGDTQGWITGFAPSVTGILAPSASTVVSVTVDVGSAPLVDTITVTAKSFDDGSVFSGSGTVTAISKLAAVEVEIQPGNTIAHCSVVDTLIDPCYRYDPLTFAVKVSNIGALDDKYELTVSSPAGVGLKLTPDELFIPAGDNEYASLSVTIPDSWWAGDMGTVTVTAVGMMSQENETLLYPTDSDSVTVSAGENKSVQIEVLPDSLEPQTGAPDSPLVWLVVMKNTGNVADNFEWSCVDVVSGRSSASALRTSWGAAVDNTGPFEVDPCKKTISYLRVTVPSDAKTSEWDTITVDISGTKGAYDDYTVMAHVVEPGPRIPEGVIEISVEAQVIAIEVWPNTWPVGVLDEAETGITGNDYFTVRNTGNVAENILIRGTDAQSMPGEPVTTWTLASTIGLDQYRMWFDVTQLSKTNQQIDGSVAPSSERTFGLTIQAPSAISTPARMWARVKLTAIKA
jgi:hypothetical protein